MNALATQIAYRVKTVIAAAFIALVGVAEWLVQDPDTASAIKTVIPTQFAIFVPVVLGAVGTILVHQFPNAKKPASSSDTAPVTELKENLGTTMIPTQTSGN